MAEYRINIIIDPAGAKAGGRHVQNELNGINSAADRTRRLITRAFAFAGVTVGVQQLVQLADTFTTVQNRLRTVTDGTAELAVVTEELFNIANRTRGSYEATAELFARVGLAAKELGVNQQQLLDFTESLNQAIVLSGASATEAQAGLIQLSQGLASGALRGDELRSVLEQLPAVADIIARSLGVTRGELRQLGADGKITADIVLNAFAEARQELSDRFARTVPTIGQSLTVLRNNFIKLVGAFDSGTGVSEALAGSILALADNLGTLARVALAASLALGTQFAIQGVSKAIAAVRTLTLAIAANPIGALAVVVLTAVSALVAFSDQISVGAGRIANLQDLGVAAFEAISGAVATVAQFVGQYLGPVADLARSVFGDVELSIEGVLRVTARVVDGIVGFFRGAARAVVVAFDDVPVNLEAVFVAAFNAVSRKFTSFLNNIISGVNRVSEAVGGPLIDAVEAFQLRASEKARGTGGRISEAIAEGIKGQTAAEDALDGILARADQIARDRLARQQQAQQQAEEARRRLTEGRTAPDRPDAEFQKLLDLLRKEGEVLKLSGQEREVQNALLAAEKKLKRELTEAERELLDAQIRSNQAAADKRALLDDIRGPLQDYERQLASLRALLDEGSISTNEFARSQRDLRIALLETQTDFASGFERGFLKVQRDIDDFASLAEHTITDAFKGAEDALVRFVTTGKLDFKDLTNSIIADLARMALRAAVTKPLFDFFSGFFGNMGSSFFSTAPTVGVPISTGTVMAAGGGLVTGPGGPTDDLIPARLSNGEYVMNAAATRAFLPLLEAINSGRAGGSVRSTPTDAALSSGGGSRGGGVTVQVIDQRSSADSEPVETRETTGADGRRVLQVMIRDTVKREADNGLLDNTMRNRYGVGRPTTRRS